MSRRPTPELAREAVNMARLAAEARTLRRTVEDYQHRYRTALKALERGAQGRSLRLMDVIEERGDS